MPCAIPTQNLYYLFCYAWNRLEEGEVVDVGSVESPELGDLFAKVLVGGVQHLFRRGIDRQYVEHDDILPVVRGRISIAESLPFLMSRAPKLYCVYDELSVDILANRILKATLLRLASIPGIDRENVERIRTVNRSLKDVSHVRLGKHHFQQVQIRRHNAFYGFLMNVCEFVYDFTLPEASGQGYRFTDILRDERKMALVFQAFIRNFLQIEQSKYQVSAIQLEWDAEGDTPSLDQLPAMNTDVFLSSPTDRIIVDTKYYGEAMQQRFSKRTLHSDNLYQIFSYLKNSERRGVEFANSRGVLLYPTVADELDFRVTIQGHELRAVTLNLNQDWKRIRSDLLGLFQ